MGTVLTHLERRCDSGLCLLALMLLVVPAGSTTAADFRPSVGIADLPKATDRIPRFGNGIEWTRPPAPRLSVLQGGTHPPVLEIVYPWSIHSDVTIETMWIPDNRPPSVSTDRIRPPQFGPQHLHGKMWIDFQRQLDETWTLDLKKDLSIEDRTYQVRTFRNTQGRPSLVVDQIVRVTPTDPYACSSYCYPEQWSRDARTLWLDLNHPLFSGKGTLLVWFLRKDAVLWRATLSAELK
ncbi:hypothetical protein JCM19992_12940 [Thermostilla marina]